MRVVEFPMDGPADSYPQAPDLQEFDRGALGECKVDAHILVQDGEDVVARASLWWRDVPILGDDHLGVIGHFAAAGQASAALLISQSLSRLRKQGCTLAIGPMDGNTWRRYRFVTDAGHQPAFFLEPENPEDYPHYFRRSGFEPIALYTSALVSDLTVQDARVPRTIERLRARGLRWRPLDLERFEDELRAIYRLSLKTFKQNFLYTPITEAEFLSQYVAFAPYVQPELTLMAEQDGELLGYLFGIPDLNQARRGDRIDTFIVKTVAVLPGRRSAGLGSVLVAESHRIAHERGYKHAIHALMHDNNKSRNISARYSQVMRRYTLYQLPLGPGR